MCALVVVCEMFVDCVCHVLCVMCVGGVVRTRCGVCRVCVSSRQSGCTGVVAAVGEDMPDVAERVSDDGTDEAAVAVVSGLSLLGGGVVLLWGDTLGEAS